ncbi:hypothetical protein CER18_03830 [Bartonella tribocorum]|uniref:Uncharacterized protein n=1 Tax=Bartonella tribocorum TaxID=85701 RepID=A0A2M6UT25_9HYPH|nr:hypothetical protein CER18_03830 [Bartonella tribocorum]
MIRNKTLIERDQGYIQFDLEPLKQVISLIIADTEAFEILDDNAYLVGAKDYIQNNRGRSQTL